MSELNDLQKRVLLSHHKAILNIRKQIDLKRFSLVIGAGISKNFRIPDWYKLIERIAKDPKVNGTSMLKHGFGDLPHASQTQMLFHHFKTKHRDELSDNNLTDGEIRAGWRNIVRKQLYRTAKKDINKIVGEQPYIKEFIDVIRKSPITVNYNFDDYIEKILEKTWPKEKEKLTRGYETIWDPQLQTRRSDSVIYHPNGFLPENKLETASKGLVFCEDEFADQLIESMGGRYTSLLHYFSRNTCLFLGLSLNDSTLKHLLRQNARFNPGHFHYYIAFQKKSRPTSKTKRAAIFESNFTIYNLITLFLTAEEIGEFGYLVNLEHDKLSYEAGQEQLSLMHCYYVTGPVCAGKTTTLSYLRNLVTYDEWLETRHKLLAKPFTKLSEDERKVVDNWIADQFSRKNHILCKPDSLAEGIHIVDRGPLDPISFTEKKEEWSQKANLLIRKICTANTDGNIKGGQVIILMADTDELEIRSKSLGKSYRKEELELSKDYLLEVYSTLEPYIIDTTRMSSDQVVKKVARIIHTKDYSEADLKERLISLKGDA